MEMIFSLLFVLVQMNMIRLKTVLTFHFMNCRVKLEIVLKIFGQPTSAVWISLRKAQGKLNTKGSIEQPSGISFSKLSCQMTLGVSVTLGVSISFVPIQIPLRKKSYPHFEKFFSVKSLFKVIIKFSRVLSWRSCCEPFPTRCAVIQEEDMCIITFLRTHICI